MNQNKTMGKRATLCLLLSGLCVLGGCTTSNPTPTTDAPYGVDIQVPFTLVSESPDKHKDGRELYVDANGVVTIYDDSQILVNDNGGKITGGTDFNTLQLGDSGEEVRKLQVRLRELGYFESNVTGIFDNDTETAVRRFERYYGIMQTGLATPTFQSHLFADDVPVYNSAEYSKAVKSHYDTLQTGSVGSDVYALQHRLRELGYPIEELTAVYDDQTAEAVAMFAQANGAQPTRVAYISLQERLYSEGAIRINTEMEEESDTLEMGATGPMVNQVQAKLYKLGYLDTEPSGIYDAETVTAVSLFQRVCGFEVTGSLPYYLQALILSDQSDQYAVDHVSLDLGMGDVGTPVRQLQQRLIDLGYATGSVSGVYDENTANAVRMFQRYNNLEQDGLAPSAVQQALFSDEALDYVQALRILAGDVITQTATPAPVVEPTPEPTANLMSTTPQPTPAPDESRTTPAPEETEEPDDDKPLPTLAAEGDENSEAFYVLPTLAVATPVPVAEMTPAPTPEPTPVIATETFSLGAGSDGPQVLSLQKRLKQLGYKIKRNSKFDEKTEDAVKELQSRIGVTQSGVVNEQLYRFLFSDAAPSSSVLMYRATQDYHPLQRGDSGESVTRLQNQLSRLGYMFSEDVYESGGEFDQATYLAVVELQQAMGYKEMDGIASPEFQCFIFSEFNTLIKQ